VYTFDDFCSLVRDGQKADLIEGAIHMASPDNTDANRLFGWLYGLIFAFAQIRQLGEVFGSRVAYRLSAYESPEPDIGFVCAARRHLIRRGYVMGPPDFAVEIASPESEERDYYKKRLQYQKAKIPEYWIVDEMQRKVTALSLSRQGQYREIRPRGGKLHSNVLSGFWLRTEWLWQEPLPWMTTVLEEILGGKSLK
jgi:Uma2 family endonuclease